MSPQLKSAWSKCEFQRRGAGWYRLANVPVAASKVITRLQQLGAMKVREIEPQVIQFNASMQLADHITIKLSALSEAAM
jgi:hypothetical protein